MIIIPAIDLYKGQCVRLRKGRFDQVSIYDYSPITLAQGYALQGAQHLHIVDLDGAKSGVVEQLPLIQAMHAPGLCLQVGGGIRSLETAKTCLQAGIEKLVIGSIAVTNPKLTAQIIEVIKAENIVLALDVQIKNNIPKPAINGWQIPTETNLWQLANYYQQLGITQILCTDIESDGMMNGPNFQLYREAVTRFPQIRWQASGGIRDVDDLERLSTLGLAAAILGRMLYESDFDISSYLARQTW
ncbi:HisA/HisF-related TIM barrel protein [Legionella maceachernii]|uniref:1-(5-phosphoribosyl)-5-[(5-phosphoribosylamino)methylideneamino] imidazole-4-carboxamide isomerase n=2 Tax=Legionella TaxID=445 RepID=A0A0W0VYP2_9GAMM|nr:1-(5-phosphoribosyl)-5-[(5-phosphoribosylamino)methylideneamino] imidazole-4-carboxamide isomerase [Legionella maceachernii]KTD25228.1 phosphoribosylformimino-5-aminoimidazole carboxamide ribotide isomerase [Legionella maceachernii]SJZ76855.1 1-(5-phosphoribosyl)-5-[(5-phosphoribosylamino)methylideneamino] imidazole-4-carboxamide isomerase [Legionella maceachernii]SUP03078.1 1-(5-phosphoribosyl)-5-[(5-phosphoribosylamino)methylideneamino] imidazole-4-carboxamide isomerase [Legionella maceache